MTIKRDWLQIWKGEDPAAFSPRCAHPVDVVFIDAQIKLMKSMCITTWKELVYWQFASPVKRHFANGASTVVVAFDNYAHVPLAKNMTQTRRVRNVPQIKVHQNETLPATIPSDWAQRIMNRTFKTKVIHLVVRTLPQLVQLQPGQRLIIDHEGHPVCHTATGEPEPLTEMQPLGEADVKFTRYMSLGRMLVEATDGDYVPIALLHLERARAAGADPADVSIYRMEINLRGPKRNAAGDIKYTYEHLHVNALLGQINRSILLKLGRSPERLGGAAGREMRVVAALVAYTGCDFSKGLPYISPRRIWDNLGVLWRGLAEALDPADASLDVQTVCDRVIARLYCLAYQKHVARERKGMEDVAERLKRQSALGQTVRDRLPEAANVACVVRNGNWVVSYWSCAETCPDPFSGPFGFSRDKKGRVCWEDESQAAH